jgi:5'-nucleotidase
MLDGKPLDAAAMVRVTVNSFLADGGDSFSVLKQGRDAKTGAMDVDAFEQFIAKRAQGESITLDRIKRIN